MKDFIGFIAAMIILVGFVAFLFSIVGGCKYDRYISYYNPAYRLGCFLGEETK